MSDSGSLNGDLSDSDGSLFSRSPSIEEVSGKERWRASEPPEEVFGDGEWKFQIIGEEVDYNGDILYEVEWDDWCRDDNSNTTWETPETISDIKWRPVQQRIRNEIASKSLSMDVLTTTDIHMTDTYLRKQAFREKLKRYNKQRPTNSFEEMAKLLAKHQEHVHSSGAVRMPTSQFAQGSQGSSSSSFPLRTNQRASTRQQTENSLAGSSSLARSSSRLSSLSVNLTSGNITSLPSRNLSPSSIVQTSSKSSNPTSVQTIAHNHSPLVARPTSTLTSTLKGKGKEIDYSPSATKSHFSHQSTQIKHEAPLSPLSPLSSITSSPVKRKERRTSSSRERSDSEESLSTLSPTKTPRKRVRRIIKSGSEDEDLRFSPLPSTYFRANSSSNNARITPNTKNYLDRRNKMQHTWTTHAQNANAAPIYFVNDIDDEEVPEVEPSFCYLESTYKFSPEIEKPPDDFLIFCSCRRCNKASLCECQQPSELVNKTGCPFFAYKSGLFTFNVPRGTEVIECNKFCECAREPRHCPNRVSQQPRKHPIEIFKTQMRGWGVRSTEAIKRGQVLGIYTGLVITREQANALPDHLTRYRFDLDGDELGDQEGQAEPDHNSYSVDSRLNGNWTRFINHSCSPNLQIYLVVHDTPPGIGLPYIVFVANQNIGTREEFTFDYNPSKSAPLIQEGGEPCHCRSSNCRGFYC